jgi:hypothetical protein
MFEKKFEKKFAKKVRKYYKLLEGREGGRVENCHYCLVSLMWMKIGSNDITAQVPGVS